MKDVRKLKAYNRRVSEGLATFVVSTFGGTLTERNPLGNFWRFTLRGGRSLATINYYPTTFVFWFDNPETKKRVLGKGIENFLEAVRNIQQGLK